MTKQGGNMPETPTSFEHLDQKELYRSAIADFAVEVDEKDSAKVIRAALLEAGVEWADYVKQHPEVAPKKEDTNVITSPNVPGESTQTPKPKPVEPQPEGNIITAQAPVAKPEDKFLIKMTRENVQYNTRGYKFTQEHPYALVAAKDAEYILSQEEGFRQAFPSELAEFYG